MNDSLSGEAVPTGTPPMRKASGTVWAVLDWFSIIGLLVYLLSQSWLRWSDPLIDYPKNLYIAWRISEGDLLYQKIANWYGPLANLVEGAAFHIFGVGFATLVWLNLALMVAVLLLLRSILQSLGNRFSAWLGSVVFLSVFAFGQYVVVANYNFITPYTSHATYSFLGLLLVLWGLLSHLKSARPFWLGIAGLGFAVAYLDKPEATLAAGGALGVYLGSRALREARHGGRAAGWLARACCWLACGFFMLWLPVFLYFWSRADAAFAWRAANYVPFTIFSGTFRNAATHSYILRVVMGLDDPEINFMGELRQGAALVAVSVALVVAARGWSRAQLRSAAWWGWLLVALVPLLAGIALFPVEHFWKWTAAGFVFPVLLASLGCAGWSLWSAWRGGADFPRALGLAVVGAAASLMMVRMILNATYLHYGFFLMPLAVLFWIHLVVVEAARPTAQRPRVNWLLPAAFAPLVLMNCAVLLGISLDFYALKTYPVGTGRDRFYALPPSINLYGWMLNTMVEAYHQLTPQARTLAVFPEGIAVNYHLRIPSPLMELEFHQLALSYLPPGKVVAELQAAPPEAVFLQARDMTEDQVLFFGQTDASGRDIILWLNDNCREVGHSGSSRFSITHNALDFLARKAPPPPPAH